MIRCVHVLLRGGEHRVYAILPARCEIILETARVPVEILAWPELGRIDEDRDHHPVGQVRRRTQQRAVTEVKSPHGRYESHASPPPAALRARPAPDRAGRSEDWHDRGRRGLRDGAHALSFCGRRERSSSQLQTVSGVGYHSSGEGYSPARTSAAKAEMAEMASRPSSA